LVGLPPLGALQLVQITGFSFMVIYARQLLIAFILDNTIQILFLKHSI
jgi:hypothetical protein